MHSFILSGIYNYISTSKLVNELSHLAGTLLRRLELWNAIAVHFGDEFAVCDFRDIWSLEIVCRDHSLEDLQEFLVPEQSVSVRMLEAFYEKALVIKQLILQLNSLRNIRVIHLTINTMSKSGCRHVKLLINSFAPQLDGQLQLPRTSDSNLQKHDS